MPASAGTPSSRIGVSARALDGARKNAPGEPGRIGLLYMLPAVALFVTFVVLPLVDGLWLSLFRWDGVSSRHWVGLHNYDSLLHDPTARLAFEHALVSRDLLSRSCR